MTTVSRDWGRAELNPRERLDSVALGMNAALEWIWTDLTRPKNDESWASLAEIDPLRSRIELFDMVWWVYFRRLQPVQPVSPI